MKPRVVICDAVKVTAKASVRGQSRTTTISTDKKLNADVILAKPPAYAKPISLLLKCSSRLKFMINTKCIEIRFTNLNPFPQVIAIQCWNRLSSITVPLSTSTNKRQLFFNGEIYQKRWFLVVIVVFTAFDFLHQFRVVFLADLFQKKPFSLIPCSFFYK